MVAGMPGSWTSATFSLRAASIPRLLLWVTRWGSTKRQKHFQLCCVLWHTLPAPARVCYVRTGIHSARMIPTTSDINSAIAIWDVLPGCRSFACDTEDIVDEWVPLWMPTRDEFHSAVLGSEWVLVEERPQGPNRFWLLELRREAV